MYQFGRLRLYTNPVCRHDGGPILTMVENGDRAEAMAIKDGRVLAVGTKAEVREQVGLPSTQSPGWAGLINPCLPEASTSADWHVQT